MYTAYYVWLASDDRAIIVFAGCSYGGSLTSEAAQWLAEAAQELAIILWQEPKF